MTSKNKHVGQHYEHAPIREAIIDIRIEHQGRLKLADLEQIYPLIKDVYPERRDFVLGQLSGQLEAGQLTATTKQDKIGYIFIGNEGKNVAQCRLNGFSFSRLAPYETWEQLRDEARKLWATYWQIVGPAPIIRVAVRYINQIDIPLPFRDFRDFVRTYPEVSTDLSQNTQLNLPATKQPVAS